jgi:hypothetical protein
MSMQKNQDSADTKMNSKNGKIEITAIAKITFIMILLLGLCIPLFCQSNSQGKAIGQGKLEAALEQLHASLVGPGQTADMIIQFVDDATPGESVDVKSLKKLARRI